MSQSYKILLSIIITAIVAGGGVFLWQSNQELVDEADNANQTFTEETEKIEETEEQSLSMGYLSSTDWGPEAGGLGAYIEFESDGTYVQSFAGEGGAPEAGTYEIVGDEIVLTGENNLEQIFTLGEYSNSFYFTEYLAEDGVIKYWNQNSAVPEESIRHLDSYILIITNEDLQPNESAVAKQYPRESSYYEYTFRFCGEGCENGEVESLSGAYRGILARTQFTQEVNGVEDYWYLANVELGWYSAALVNGNEVGKVSEVWIHGSELE